MPDIHEPLLVNIVGHTAGAVLFGIFLILFLKDRAGSRHLLSFAAAALAFLWDAISLFALSVNSPDVRAHAVAISFAALSLLPAVLLQIALQSRLRVIVTAGYALSGTAVVLHLIQHKSAALLLIPVGFGILTSAATTMLALRPVPGSGSNAKRIAGSMCLFLFAITFVHFGSASANHDWSSELIIHHAGIPIALFVLLQDYRFVLLDAFVRFLANVLLAGLVTAAAARAIPIGKDSGNPVQPALLAVGCCVVLIGFALLRNGVQRLLTRVVFRRPDFEKAREIVRHRRADEPEDEYIRRSAAAMAGFLRSSRTEVMREEDTPAEIRQTLRPSGQFRWADAVLPLRLSQRDVRYVFLGRRQGGRRYLSEDFDFLNRLAMVIAEQVEQFRTAEVQRLVSEAELRALQSQINPHFLFNALNTLYGTIPRNAPGARKTVLNLADIFRYFLQSEKTFIPLGEEMQIVRAYLEIEALRLGPRLTTHVDVDEDALAIPIPILSIQPLVENAIKHGIARRATPGWLRVWVKSEGESLSVTVEDSGAGEDPSPSAESTGVGLGNVRRRLELCYGGGAALRFEPGANGTRVEFRIPAFTTSKSSERFAPVAY